MGRDDPLIEDRVGDRAEGGRDLAA